MQFRLRTLIFITFAIGVLSHVMACLRGHSVVKLSQLLLVFFFGASIVILSPIMVAGIVGRKYSYLGVVFGVITWSSLLYLVCTYEGEIFRFVWLHIFLLVLTSSLTLWALARHEDPETPVTHSVEKLITKRVNQPNKK